MEELFTLIGKLYYDLVRAQSIIENLKKQLDSAKLPSAANHQE
jgi:hypothetical protein